MDIEILQQPNNFAGGLALKGNKRRVLLVEDENEIRQLIRLHLMREGFEVDEIANGEAALNLLSEKSYHLVILDWMLPGMSGLEITRWIRSQPNLNRTPILFVTAKVEPEHIASGLDAGADDYLPKPFDTLVLMARVHALLRRNEWLNQEADQKPNVADAVIAVGGLELNPDTVECRIHGQPIELTRSEFRLLQNLMQNQGKVLSRERLIEEIQGEGVNVIGRTVDTHVFGLRKKLGDCGDMIETIRGVGYRVRYSGS